MKCKSCKNEVPSKFVAAIKDNKCPACGKKMVSDTSYQKIFNLKSQLSVLDLDENTLISISAALSDKFTLVPKDLALEEEIEEEEETPPQLSDKPKPKPMTERRIDKAVSSASIASIEVEEEDDEITDEEEAALAEEWGLNIGDKKSATLIETPVKPSPELFDLVSQIKDLDGANDSAKHDELLTRAKETSSKMKIKRIE